jgi:predicted kinase
MKRLAIITIGIPGSGKTTTLTPLIKKYGLTRISRDDIREEWFGNPLLQVDKEAVTAEAERRATEALAKDHSVVKDSTFTESHKRIRAISSLKENGAERVIGLVFTTPLATAQERNRTRKVTVDPSVVELLHTQLESDPPMLEEGFDALYTDTQLAKFEATELHPLLD